MFCGNCGKKLNDDAMFCSECGSRINQPIASQSDVGVEIPSGVSQPLGMHNPLGGNLPLVIGLCAAAAIITVSAVALVAKIGFGDKGMTNVTTGVVKEADGDGLKTESGGGGSNDVVKVSKKVEKEYMERIEAYEAYFNQKKSEGGEYGVAVSLDLSGLPLMWLYPIGSDGVLATQLMGYDGEVKILAEARGMCLDPIMTEGFVAAAAEGESAVYVYDESKGLFNVVSYSGGSLKSLSEENGITMYNYYYAIGGDQTVAYIGRIYHWIGDPREHGDFVYPDGSVEDWRLVCQKRNWLDKDTTFVDGVVTKSIGIDADALFRALKASPAYAVKDLMMLYIANDVGFWQSRGMQYAVAADYDLKAVTAPKLTDEDVKWLALEYLDGGSGWGVWYYEECPPAEEAWPDELVDRTGTLNLEDYEHEGAKVAECADGILTIYSKSQYAGALLPSYRFKVELNDEGTRIKKVTYIDPLDSEPAWKKAYMGALRDGTIFTSEYTRCGLDDINSDGIPELIVNDDGRTTSIYTFANNKVEGLLVEDGSPSIEGSDLVFFNRYAAVVYRVTSKVETVFYAEVNFDNGKYQYNGAEFDYEEIVAEMAKVGIDGSATSCYEPPCSLAEIKNAIINY